MNKWIMQKSSEIFCSDGTQSTKKILKNTYYENCESFQEESKLILT